MSLGLGLGFKRHLTAAPVPPALPDIKTLMAGWLDATDAASYSGSGQTISSLIAAPADGTAQSANSAYLGTLTITDGSDPVFTGTAGNSGAYLALGGTMELQQANATLTANSILNNAHRSDVAGSFVAWAGVIPGETTANHAICGNASSSGQAGFGIYLDTSGRLTFSQRSGSSSLAVTMFGVPRNVPVLIIISWNGTLTANNIRLWVNTTSKSVWSGTFIASTAAATRNMYICGCNNVWQQATGAQFKTFLYGNSFLDDTQAAQIFAALQTKHGIDYAGGGVFGGGQKFLAAMGDSMTAYGNVTKPDGTATEISNNAEGQYYNYMAFTNNKLLFSKANNFGIAGYTSTQVKTHLSSSMIGCVADAVMVMCGTNDIGLAGNAVNDQASADAQVAAILANLDYIYNYVINTWGKTCIAVTIAPRSYWNAGAQAYNSTQIAYAKANIKAVNAAILARNGSYGGKLICLDLYPALNDGADSPVANATVDGLHFSPYGAMLYGRRFRDLLAARLPALAAPNFAASNLLANGTLTGTSGTVSGGASGVVATGFGAVLAGVTGATPVAVCSEPSAGVQQIAFSCPAGASTKASVKFTQTVSGGFAVGDILFGKAIVQVDTPTPVNILESALALSLTGTGLNGSQLTLVTGFAPWGAGQYIAETYVAPGQYLITTPDMPILGGTGLAVEWFYRMTGDTAAGLPASGTVRIKGAGLFKR